MESKKPPFQGELVLGTASLACVSAMWTEVPILRGVSHQCGESRLSLLLYLSQANNWIDGAIVSSPFCISNSTFLQTYLFFKSVFQFLETAGDSICLVIV